MKIITHHKSLELRTAAAVVMPLGKIGVSPPDVRHFKQHKHNHIKSRIHFYI